LLLARNPAAQDIEELGNLYTVQKITGSQDEVGRVSQPGAAGCGSDRESRIARMSMSYIVKFFRLVFDSSSTN
jgi:hypothetical protein